MITEIAENSVIKTDGERWIADTYALWAEHMGGSWRCIGGYQKNEDNAEMLLNIMEQDWGITNPENGMETVNRLIGKKNHHNPATDGWDYCRATQLLGLFYLVGFIDRRTLTDFNCTVGKIMQEQFHSWKELCESYLRGCEAWYRSSFDSAKAEEKIRERRALYKKFRKQKDGPYRLPWKLPLASAAANEGSYYTRWQKQEEAWAKSHHRHIYKQFWCIIAPCIFFGLALIMGLVGLADSTRSPFELALGGALASIPVLLLVLFVLFITTRKGRMRRAIRHAQQRIGLDETEKELFGMELLDALAAKRSCLEYWDKPPQGLKSPAHVLVTEHFFYQANSRPLIILVRRSDLDFLEWGTENKSYYAKKGVQHKARLYTIYFYLRSSREQRLEGRTTADNGMGFYDKKPRDTVFFMMGGQPKQ